MDQRTSDERRTPRRGGDRLRVGGKARSGSRGELVHPRRGAPGVRQGQSRHLPLAAEHPGRSSKNRRRAEVHRRRRRRSQDSQLSTTRHCVAAAGHDTGGLRGERHVRAREGGERADGDARFYATGAASLVRVLERYGNEPLVFAQHVLAPRDTRAAMAVYLPLQRGDAQHHRRGGRARHRRPRSAAADDGGGCESAGLDEHPRGFLSAFALLLSQPRRTRRSW